MAFSREGKCKMPMAATETRVIELSKDIPLLVQCGLVMDKKLQDPKNRRAKQIRDAFTKFRLGQQQRIVLNGTCSIFGSIYSPIPKQTNGHDFPPTPVQSIEKVATGKAFQVVNPERTTLAFGRECTVMLANLVGGDKVYFVFD